MELNDKIKNAFKEECPDIFDRIKSTVENTEQLPVRAGEEKWKNKFFDFISTLGAKKISAIAASFVLIFTLGILLGMGLDFAPSGSAYATLYLDVNPSIAIVVDNNSIVVECTAANEDAELILNGMQLVGVNTHTALNAIIGSMYMNGYLDTANGTDTILISAKATEDNRFSTLLSDVANDVNSIFEKSNIKCSIVAQKIAGDYNDRNEGESIPPGKIGFIDKILMHISGGEYTFDDLKNMSIKELSAIYRSLVESDDEDDDEMFFGDSDVIGPSEAIDILLDHLSLTRDEVSDVYAILSFAKHPGEDDIESVYVVTFRLDDEKHSYCVDIDYDDEDDIWEKESIINKIPGLS